MSAIFEDLKDNKFSYRDKLKSILSITDEKILAKIALADELDLSFRKTAIDKIEDQALLYEVASQIKDYDIIQSIIPRFKSKRYLNDLKNIYLKKKLSFEHRHKINEVMKTINNSISFIFDD